LTSNHPRINEHITDCLLQGGNRRTLVTAGATGYEPPLFENMGVVICLNLYRNSEGVVGWGGGGIENVIEYRLRRD